MKEALVGFWGCLQIMKTVSNIVTRSRVTLTTLQISSNNKDLMALLISSDRISTNTTAKSKISKKRTDIAV